MPPAAGLIAHVKLARIMGYLVCNTYRIAPTEQSPSISTRSTAQHHIRRTLELLEEWKEELSPELRLDPRNPHTDIAICKLHMAYYQLVLLNARPLFFVAVKKAVAKGYVGQSRRDEPWLTPEHHHYQQIKAGLDAARWNMGLVRWLDALHQQSGFGSLMHADLHYAFNAAINIMLEALVSATGAPTTQSSEADIAFAIHVLEQDAKSGNDYSKDCWRVLTDLNSLTMKIKDTTAWAQHMFLSAAESSSAVVNPPELVDTNVQPEAGGEWLSDEHLALQSQLNNVPMTETTAADATSIFGPMFEGLGMSEGDALYQEMVAWMETDDLGLYGSSLQGS